MGLHVLAALIYVLPKVGPLADLSIKGPTIAAEEDYVRSANSTLVELRRQIRRMGTGNRLLADKDLDTGAPVQPGGYRLTDSTYAELLHQLTRTPGNAIPPGLKADVAAYYADLSLPIATKKDARRWAEVQAELPVLAGMATTKVIPVDPVLADMAPQAGQDVGKPLKK